MRRSSKAGQHGSKVYTDTDGQRTFDLEPGHMRFAKKQSGRTQGKGDGRRPENRAAFDAGWERIFGKKK